MLRPCGPRPQGNRKSADHAIRHVRFQYEYGGVNGDRTTGLRGAEFQFNAQSVSNSISHPTGLKMRPVTGHSRTGAAGVTPPGIFPSTDGNLQSKNRLRIHVEVDGVRRKRVYAIERSGCSAWGEFALRDSVRSRVRESVEQTIPGGINSGVAHNISRKTPAKTAAVARNCVAAVTNCPASYSAVGRKGTGQAPPANISYTRSGFGDLPFACDARCSRRRTLLTSGQSRSP